MPRWTDEELIIAVKKSENVGQVIRYLNGSLSGTAYKTIRKHIDRLQLNSDHFDSNARHRKRFDTLRISSEDIFVENSSWKISNQVMKKRLIEESSKVDRCEVCGQSNIHNNISLVLQLDHINGISNDNRLENLRILCPNCHTQTKTWGNKKR